MSRPLNRSHLANCLGLSKTPTRYIFAKRLYASGRRLEQDRRELRRFSFAVGRDQIARSYRPDWIAINGPIDATGIAKAIELNYD
jgi:hypothetical protein